METIHTLNSTEREATMARMEAGNYELLVIGGGITGAGIALDAATRGIKTALVEMQDYAAGTSSRSTKLIHGGLRYLKQFEFRLVREVGRERAIVYNNAPHIVVPEPMLLPLITGGTYSKLATSFGLWLYDRLAGVDKEERRKMLKMKGALAKEPLLRRDGLKGAGYYWEYRTDDNRLTLEILKTAAAKGVDILNYAEALDLLTTEHNQVRGATIRDQFTGKEFDLNSTHVVNAAGPWVDLVRKIDGSLSEKRLHHTKGIHIVLKHDRLPIQQPVYFDVPDGRMIFAIPRDGITYVGTTDTDYAGRLDRPNVTQKDVKYLVEGVNFMFPTVNLTAGDVISTWAGIRPLIHEEGKSPSELSRKDEIFFSHTGLVTIAGGKLTGYRKMAERTVDVIMKRISDASERANVRCQTDRVTLAGGELEGREEVSKFADLLSGKLAGAGMDKRFGPILAFRYGSNADTIFDLAKAQLGKALSPDHAVILGELDYCVTYEGAVSPSDFFVRRTSMIWFDRDEIGQYLPDVLNFLADKFDWEPETKRAMRDEFMAEYEGVLTFE